MSDETNIPAATETPEGVVVTQADREAADALDDALGFLTATERPLIEQAFARHRLAHTPTLRGEEVERLRNLLRRAETHICAMVHPSDRDGITRRFLGELDAALSQPLAVDTGQSGEAEQIKRALEPVMHWYQSDEHEPRPLADIVADVVADLQHDRAEVLKASAATPAPSVSPEPAGEVQKAWQRISDALDGIEGGMHAELEDAASAMWPLIDALASSPIPKTFPREADLIAAVAWFTTQTRLSLYHYSPMYGDDDDQSVEWRVDRQSGPINDREWDTIARGATAQDAILAAHAAALIQKDRQS